MSEHPNRGKTKTTVLTFLAGVEAFHALTHAYLSLSERSEHRWHPVELLGIKADRKFHAIAAAANAAIAIGFGLMARKSITELRSNSSDRGKVIRDRPKEGSAA